MCWATRCASPSFPQGLTFDFPSEAKKRERRIKAGCNPSGNKCGTKNSGPGHRGPPNISCDEYPFASVKEADQDHKVSRCVPGPEQSSQGGQIVALQKQWQKEGKTYFTINFGNPGSNGVNYCNNEPCKSDGFEVQDGKVKRGVHERLFRYYTTSSGMVLASLEPIETPSNYSRQIEAPSNFGPGLDTWSERYDEVGEVYFVQDTIVEELSWDHFLDSTLN